MKKEEIYQQTLRHFLDPIWHLIEDQDVSEILINGPDHIYYEKSGKLKLSDKRFLGNDPLNAAVNNIAE